MNRALPALLLILLATVALAWPRLSAQGSDASGSPHDAPDGCPACHDPGTSPGVVGPPRPAVATCRGCHPTADMHTVGVVPETTGVPHGWPLERAAVTCATCHAEPACDAQRPKDPPFLRGGPYTRPAQLCSRCHDTGSLRRSNPHPSAAEDPSDAGACVACHVAEPAPGASPATARLRGAPEQICGGCHGVGAHTGLADHLGVRLSPAAHEALDGKLPLGAEGAIACWTCHDVHTSPSAPTTRSTPSTPTTPPRSARRAGALARHAEGLRLLARAGRPPSNPDSARLALPADDGALCRACHGSGP